MNTIHRKLPSLLILIAMVIISVLAYDTLPDEIPSQFGLDGRVTDTQSRNTAVILLPLIYLGVYALVNVMIRISPQKFSMPNSKGAMDIILFGVGVMILSIHSGMMFGSDSLSLSFVAYGLAAFYVITGNVFGKTERNFFIGIRLPWTIASTANWKATHRFAGKLMVGAGLALALITTFYSAMWLIIVCVLGPALIPLVYSPYYYFRYER